MRTLSGATLFFWLGLLPIAAAGQTVGCRPADFSVDQLSERVVGDSVSISGRLLNKCAQASGAHIKVTLYDKSGSVFAAQDLWPAGTGNVPARSAFPFTTVIKGARGSAKFEARVLQTKIWPRR